MVALLGAGAGIFYFRHRLHSSLRSTRSTTSTIQICIAISKEGFHTPWPKCGYRTCTPIIIRQMFRSDFCHTFGTDTPVIRYAYFASSALMPFRCAIYALRQQFSYYSTSMLYRSPTSCVYFRRRANLIAGLSRYAIHMPLFIIRY